MWKSILLMSSLWINPHPNHPPPTGWWGGTAQEGVRSNRDGTEFLRPVIMTSYCDTISLVFYTNSWKSKTSRFLHDILYGSYQYPAALHWNRSQQLVEICCTAHGKWFHQIPTGYLTNTTSHHSLGLSVPKNFISFHSRGMMITDRMPPVQKH